MAYEGSIDLISGIRPKNNGEFPLVNAKDVYVDDSKRLDASLTEINDALTYTKEWVETLTPDDRGSGMTYITFKPTGFGARSNFRLKSFTIMSSDVASYLPSKDVYAKVLDPEATAHAKAVSHPVSVTSTNTNYTFVFDESEELVYNKQYKMIFSQGAADGSPLLIFGVRVHNATVDQDIYYANYPRMKPITGWVYSYDSLVTGVNDELDSRVPTTRTINNKELSTDISLSASDVGAATSAQGTKADTAIQTVKVNGTALEPDANNAVDIPPETEIEEYRLPDDCFPMKYTGPSINPTLHTINSNDGLRFENFEDYILVWDTTDGAISLPVCLFYKSTLKYADVNSPDTVAITFSKNGVDTEPTANTWPVLEKDAVFVRDVGVLGKSGNQTLNGALDIINQPSDGTSGLRIIEGSAFGSRMDAEYGSESISSYNNGALRGRFDFPIKSGTFALLQNLADNYDSHSTYELNNLCIHATRLYRCTTAIAATEAWNAEHWTEATIEDVLAAIRSALGGKLGNSGDQTLNGTLYQHGVGPNGITKGIYLGNIPNDPMKWAITAWGSAPDTQLLLPFSAEGTDGTLALLSQIYAAVQQIAPAFDATRTEQTKYEQYDLCSKDGVVYQCTNANGHYGAWNSSNWTAKKVSELFMPLTGWKFDTTFISFTNEGISIIDSSTGEGSVFSTTHHFLARRTRDGNLYIYTVPNNSGTLAIAAGSGHEGNLAALDVNGNPVDSGKRTADLALLDSPVFMGRPTAPDIGLDAPDGQIANKKYVDTLMDTVSPLVARSFTVPKNGDDGYGGASTIFFYPRYLGMSNGDRMKSFIVRRRISGGPQTAVSVYVELQDSSGATLATTKTQTLPAELGVYVSFEFPESVAILNKDAQYRLVFYDANSPSSPYTANLNFYQYPQNNPDCYFGTYSQKFVPDLTVQYYAWASDLVPISRKINSHALTEDVTLTASDIEYAMQGTSVSMQVELDTLENTKLGNTGDQMLSGDLTLDDGGAEKSLWFTSATDRLGLDISGGHNGSEQTLWNWPSIGFTGGNVLALTSDIRYNLGAPITIDSNAVQTDATDPTSKIDYAEVTLLDRTANIVSIETAIDELRVTLPAAVDGKVRDFGLAINVGDGTAALAAPALVVSGAGTESPSMVNPDGEMPELVDGTATMPGYTLLYFSEIAEAVFLVKGEQVKEITQ